MNGTYHIGSLEELYQALQHPSFRTPSCFFQILTSLLTSARGSCGVDPGPVVPLLRIVALAVWCKEETSAFTVLAVRGGGGTDPILMRPRKGSPGETGCSIRWKCFVLGIDPVISIIIHVNEETNFQTGAYLAMFLRHQVRPNHDLRGCEWNLLGGNRTRCRYIVDKKQAVLPYLVLYSNSE